jgi:crotonobetainyl-CoA:carnitine CoA-transferase CaiB-like acyl-CoA transferase
MAGNPLANPYQCKDGKWIMLLMLQPDRRWPDFCKAVGIEHLEHNPKFSSMLKRNENRQEIIAILDRVFATKTRGEWMDRFGSFDLQWDACNTFNDLAEDPQALANDCFAPIKHPARGLIKVPASPLNFSKTPASVRRHAPNLGEHTEEILLEMGYSWEQIAALKGAKATL